MVSEHEYKRALHDLGYVVVRNGKELVYRRPDGQTIIVPCTPSDWRGWTNAMAFLRRRHPVELARHKAAPEVRAARRHRDRQRQTPLAALPEPEVIVVRPTPDRTQCVDCGRLWLSEIDPTGRACPHCGGDVLIGRRETREFTRRLVA